MFLDLCIACLLVSSPPTPLSFPGRDNAWSRLRNLSNLMANRVALVLWLNEK